MFLTKATKSCKTAGDSIQRFTAFNYVNLASQHAQLEQTSPRRRLRPELSRSIADAPRTAKRILLTNRLPLPGYNGGIDPQRHGQQMEHDKPTADDLKRVKVTIRALLPEFQIEGVDLHALERVDPSILDGKRLIITVPLSKRDYRKTKEAFDKGALKALGILSVSAEPLEATEPEQTGFAKSEEQKRKPRTNRDSAPDRP